MKNKIRILHIDDDLNSRKIVKDTLLNEQDEFEIKESASQPEIEICLNESDFDLIILSDINIPDFDELDVLKKVKEKKPETPVIIVTGNESIEIAVEAMKLGAADYVIKSEKHIQKLASGIRKVIENKKIQENQDTTLTELRKSEERFRLLFDTSMDAVLLTDPNGTIHETNAAACKIFGRTEEEIKQIGRYGILDITDPQLTIALKERARLGKYHGELTGLRRDGTPFPIEISSTSFHDSGGNPRNSMIIRDISERKHFEELLQENEKLYRNLFESLLNGFVYCRMLFDNGKPNDFIYLKVNKAFETSTGVKDAVGKRVSEVFPGIQKSDPKLFEIYGRVALTGKPETFEIYVETLKSWYLISVYSPQKEYFVSIFEVITDRKLYEETILKERNLLHISEEKFRNVFEYSVVGKSLTTLGGKLKTNKAYRDILGYSEEELLNLNWQEITHKDDVENDKKNAQFVVSGEKESATWEKRYIHKNGNIVWVNISTSLQRDVDGNPLYFITSIIDITEKKLAFEAVKATEIRYRRLFESAKDGILILDAETGMIVDVNPYLVELLGYSTDQFQGKKIWEIGVFSDIIANQAKFIELQQNEYIRYDDLPLKAIDGRHIDVEFVSNVYEVNHQKVIQCNIRDITERKIAEEQRIIQTTALEATAVSVIITDAEGTISWVNNTFTQMTGFSKEEAIGSNPRILKSGLHEEPFYKNIWDTIKAGKVWRGEIINKRKDNSLLNDEISITPVLNKNGIVQNFIALKQDITERKNIEKALKESEMKFRFLLENSADAIFIIDSKGKFIYTNKAVTDILGYSSEEMLRKTIVDVSPEDKIENYFENLAEIFSTGKAFIEVELIKKDGNYVSVDVNSVLLPDGLVYGSCRDITERKQAEAEIQNLNINLELKVEERTKQLVETNINLQKEIKERTQAEERIHLIYNASPYAIVLVDSKGIIHLTNNTTEDYFGYEMNQLIGENIDMLVPRGKDVPHSQHIGNFFDDATKRQMGTGRDLFAMKKDGSVFPVEIGLTPILIDGEFMTLTNIINITERKQAEYKIREAKAQAEHANQAKSEFLANMSHEIRTPMNAVLGYAELLNNILEDNTQKDYLKSITSSGKTLLTLINDILDLSKIEEGKLELTFGYINTHSFFAEFERIFSWKVEEKGLTFILDIVSGLPAGLYVDETRLRQILLNIIGNAVKFTQQGHIKLKVYIENPQIIQLSSEKSEEFIDLVIEVEDTGIGISSEFQEHIFEPFSQEQYKNQFGGTGLGLAISRRLLSLMNGTISLQSEINIGTKFQIKILDISYLRDFERIADSFQIDPVTIVFEQATILIVDDIVHNRKYFVDALKNTNINIVEAEDGLSGYSLAKDIVPDLIITDLLMPRLDGFGLLNKIQGNTKLSHIPVIAYSASVMREQKEKVFNSKFSGLLIKPVSVTDLYLEIMKYLPYTNIQVPEKDNPAQEELLNQIVDIQSLVHSLETDYTVTWQKFEVRQPMDEVREFGENLVTLGNAHHAGIIKEYGQKIISAADNFNIQSILILLNKYQSIVNEIKKFHSNN